MIYTVQQRQKTSKALGSADEAEDGRFPGKPGLSRAVCVAPVQGFSSWDVNSLHLSIDSRLHFKNRRKRAPFLPPFGETSRKRRLAQQARDISWAFSDISGGGMPPERDMPAVNDRSSARESKEVKQ